MNEQDPVDLYQIFILFVCLLAIVLAGIDPVVPTSDEITQIIRYTDHLICFLFLLDFVICFTAAKHKLKYFFTLGWLDLISAIPYFTILRLARWVKIVRLIQLLRLAKSAHRLSTLIIQKRAESVFLATTSLSLLILFVSSIAITLVETGPNINIVTGEDAIWWAFVTMTTVGYGDYYPVTTAGRIIAAVLMLSGISVFGTYTGFISSYFLRSTTSNDAG